MRQPNSRIIHSSRNELLIGSTPLPTTATTAPVVYDSDTLFHRDSAVVESRLPSNSASNLGRRRSLKPPMLLSLLYSHHTQLPLPLLALYYNHQ